VSLPFSVLEEEEEDDDDEKKKKFRIRINTKQQSPLRGSSSILRRFKSAMVRRTE